MKQAKAIYSGIATARESATISHLCWLRLKGRLRSGRALEKGEAFQCALIGGGWHREAMAGYLEAQPLTIG